jgi:5-methylcytosine-specific restriction endonuclease McrA
VFKRDNYTCLYCSKLLSTKQITLDHIIPRSKGGVSSFENCATACTDCNTKKGAKMLEEIGMRLAKKPETPEGYLVVSAYVERWHPNWDIFVCPNE